MCFDSGPLKLLDYVLIASSANNVNLTILMYNTLQSM